MNSEVLRDCKSVDCKLNNKALPALKRIKAHCISCVPEQNLKGVKECTGRLLDDKTCPLHSYRLGKNPKRAGIGNIRNIHQKACTQQPFVYQESLK
jgi:hypothetical protein